MNYRQLKQILDNMTEDELNQDVTVYSATDDEFIAATSVQFSSEADNNVLDDNHAYLVTV